jgi:hypothetical protein
MIFLRKNGITVIHFFSVLCSKKMYNPWQTRTISKAMETRLKLRDLGIFTEHSEMLESDLEEYKFSEDLDLSEYVQSIVEEENPKPKTYSKIAATIKFKLEQDQEAQEEDHFLDGFSRDLCPHFLRGKCRFKKFCRFSHILSICPYCKDNLPLNRVSASAHLSRCWKRDGQDNSRIFKRLTIYTLDQ